MKGLIAGVVAGVVGAALWAIIAAVTGYEIGWLAWGIGAAVGAGVAWGSEGSPVTGGLAVVIAILAILAGKFITVEVVLANEMDSAKEEIFQQLDNEEFLISWLADAIVQEQEQEGKTINWPSGVNPEEASAKEDYPGEIWTLAEVAWSAMSDEDKEDFKNTVQEQINENMQMYADSVKKDGFLASFSPMDGIFFLLAVVTAYKVGSRAD